MKFYRVLRQASKGLLRNKGRSFLTVLGIVIGIGSVIALISLGAGVRQSISGRISTLGTTNIIVMPGAGFGAAGGEQPGSGQKSSGPQPGGGGGFNQTTSTLSVADLNSLSDHAKHPDLKAVSGVVSGSAIFTVGGSDTRYTITGVSAAQFPINNLVADKGVVLTDSDITQARRVAVLGSQFSSDLYGAANPLGQTLTIGNDKYTVIGVLAHADESGFSNPNIQIYVPYTAAMTTFNVTSFSRLTVQAESDSVVDQAKTDIETTLLANHGIKDAKLADFSVNTSKDLLSTISTVTSLLTSLLAGIAAISLVVGGIGIMNIMLVSVTERTREIGLRKAVGAKTSDILGQFMAEAILLTLFGGLLGIGLGKLIGSIAARFLGFSPIITASAILLAVGVSSGVGLVFGIYPAAKAAHLNPIDALRYE